MASQTELKILLSKGPLAALWNDKALKSDSNITINNGQLYIGLGSDNRAMLFIDDNGVRHPFTADVAWDDIRNLPTNLALTSDVEQLETTLTNQVNTKVNRTGDTMTGPLSIAADATAAGLLKKVTLDYNEQTESLDFTFAQGE